MVANNIYSLLFLNRTESICNSICDNYLSFSRTVKLSTVHQDKIDFLSDHELSIQENLTFSKACTINHQHVERTLLLLVFSKKHEIWFSETEYDLKIIAISGEVST